MRKSRIYAVFYIKTIRRKINMSENIGFDKTLQSITKETKSMDNVMKNVQKSMKQMSKMMEEIGENTKSTGTVFDDFFNIVSRTNSIFSLANTVQTLTSAMSTSNKITEIATTKQLLLNAAQAMSPALILVTGVMALVGAMGSYSSSTDTAVSKAQELNDALKENKENFESAKESARDSAFENYAEADAAEDLLGKIKGLNSIRDRSITQQSELNSYISQLKTILPDVTGYISEQNGEYKIQYDAIEKLIENMEKQLYTELVMEEKKNALSSISKEQDTVNEARDQKAANEARIKEIDEEISSVNAEDVIGGMFLKDGHYISYNKYIEDLTTEKGQLEGDNEELETTISTGEANIAEYKQQYNNAEDSAKETLLTVGYDVDAEAQKEASIPQVNRVSEENAQDNYVVGQNMEGVLTYLDKLFNGNAQEVEQASTSLVARGVLTGEEMEAYQEGGLTDKEKEEIQQGAMAYIAEGLGDYLEAEKGNLLDQQQINDTRIQELEQKQSKEGLNSDEQLELSALKTQNDSINSWLEQLNGASSGQAADVKSILSAIRNGGIKITVTQQAYVPYAEPAKNALGTGYFGGGLTWVGEHGPELMDLPAGSKIYSNSTSKNMSARNGVIITGNTFNVREEADIEKIAAQLVEKLEETIFNMP